MITKGIMRRISIILIVSMLNLCLLTPYCRAEMVTTETAIQSESPPSIQITRQSLLDLLHRESIQKKLKKYGISKVEAAARTNSLTDEELSEIVGKVDRLIAGGHKSDFKDFIKVGDEVVEEEIIDPIEDSLLEIILWTLLIGFVAVAYLVGLLIKSLACPFQEDCSELLRPWWIWDDDSENQIVVPIKNPTESPSVKEPVNSGNIYIPGTECDTRKAACEWSVR